MDGPSARKPSLFLESRAGLSFADLSPDGRWMAYGSSESDSGDVYVQPYPGPSAKIQVSTMFGG